MSSTPGDAPQVAQRWRLVLAREAGPTTQRDHELAWEAALDTSGLPCARGTAGRRAPRITFGAPLPTGVAGEAELADIFLVGRRRSAEVRHALAAVLPSGTALVDLHDIWVGAPGLPSLVVASDYRIRLPLGVDAATLGGAAGGLLASPALPRVRGADRHYDLRPLIAELAVTPDAHGPTVQCRLRHHPTAGTGRPDELLAALAERLGAPLAPIGTTRVRLVLADEPGQVAGPERGRPGGAG